MTEELDEATLAASTEAPRTRLAGGMSPAPAWSPLRSHGGEAAAGRRRSRGLWLPTQRISLASEASGYVTGASLDINGGDLMV